MSQENVEIVRACSESINRGDLEALLEHCAPDCEFDLSRAVGPIHGTYRGGQFRRAFKEFCEPWESYRAELDGLIDAGELIVASVTGYFRGRDGVEVQTQTAYVWTIRDGAIEHICFYQERRDALEAAGLSE